jgi:uncharacterized Zn-binding protein involved in type VI secretion
MNKNLNGIIVVAVIGLLGFLAYKKFGKPNSRKVVINYLDATFGGDHSAFVNSADKGYIDNWSDAIMNGSTTFTFNGTTFVTRGGKTQK